jgi:hypothetical protein
MPRDHAAISIAITPLLPPFLRWFRHFIFIAFAAIDIAIFLSPRRFRFCLRHFTPCLLLFSPLLCAHILLIAAITPFSAMPTRARYAMRQRCGAILPLFSPLFRLLLRHFVLMPPFSHYFADIIFAAGCHAAAISLLIFSISPSFTLLFSPPPLRHCRFRR